MDAATTASAGYVDDAVDALAGSNVYVSSEVGGSTALADSLRQQVDGSSIAIAVFSDNASLEASGPDIVSQLADRTGFDTIIVAVGDDLSAGSRVLESGQAMQIANQAEGSADSLTTALMETVAGVQVAGDQNVAIPDGGDPLLGIVLAIAAVLTGVGITIGLIVGTRRRRDRPGRGVSDAVRRHVDRLQALSGEYAAVGARGNQVAAQTGAEIAAIAANVVELFTRLDKKNDAQAGVAAAEYDDKLRKLTAALDRDYLLDILTHPNLWDDPDERVREVRGSVTAVSDELIENIKQVNARRGLHFQVSLDGLIGGRKELRDWEREFDNMAGDGDPSV